MNANRKTRTGLAIKALLLLAAIGSMQLERSGAEEESVTTWGADFSARKRRCEAPWRYFAFHRRRAPDQEKI
jgi:hypothetical protein